jgi:acetyl-CoA acetyltransferase
MQTFKRLDALSNISSIVGIGETDYLKDYANARKNIVDKDSYGLAAIAFKRAIADSGISKDEIDGLIVGPTISSERIGEILGINPNFSAQGDAVNSIMFAAMAIHSGAAECIALIYGNNQRTGGVQYGGPQAEGGDRRLAYTYFAPWGMTSQGALYAIMTQRYMALHGVTETELAEVAISQRQFASMNSNAVMQDPLSIDQYLKARYICEPLRLNDYCLINDGGVALIICSKERAKKIKRKGVVISGFGRSDINKDSTSLRPRLIDFYLTAHKETAKQVYSNANTTPSDIDTLQIYDSFSPHILFALEGFDFCPIGTAGQFISKGAIGPGGRLPINTSGGHLSESYMQGWNHQLEIVRQLRNEADKRQVKKARVAQYISDVAGKVASIIYKVENS